MGKLIVMGKEEELYRVWNFVVPMHSLGNNSRLHSIPPLGYSPRKAKKTKTRNSKIK